MATLGHTDEITIGDAGLPIDESVQRIDLALTQGIPSFWIRCASSLAKCKCKWCCWLTSLLKSVLIYIAHYSRSYTASNRKQVNLLRLSILVMMSLKPRTVASRAVVRTGECTPYANVIFQSGVVF
ncbi:D-ribose pyranase [Vibrio metschnikovii]